MDSGGLCKSFIMIAPYQLFVLFTNCLTIGMVRDDACPTQKTHYDDVFVHVMVL